MSNAKIELLIIEDELEIAELIEFHAERSGMRARKIHSGRLALELIRREKPDIIVLDLMLPDLDGLEVCRRLKQDEATRTIPIVMVTAKGEEADVVAGIELGADDYVIKPVQPSRVDGTPAQCASSWRSRGRSRSLGGSHHAARRTIDHRSRSP